MRPPLRALAIVLLGVAALWLRLGHLGLTEPSEGRYAEIAREMHESGDWVTPRLNYQRHFEKPPFAYWMTAIGVGLFGPDNFGARFMTALFATALVAIVYGIGATLFDPLAGALAAGILASQILFFVVARTVTADLYTTFWGIAAVGCFLRWYGDGEDRPGWRWGYYLCLGGGLLTKGPAVFVPALLPVVLFLGIRKDWAALRRLRLVRGLLVSAAMVVPWLVLAEQQTPGIFRYLVVDKATSAVASSKGYHSVDPRLAPIYYLPVLLVGCMPWSFFLPAFGAREVFARPERPLRREWGPLFLFVWWPTILVAFTGIAAKLPTYLLPITVPVALMNGRLWSDSIADPGRARNRWESVGWNSWFVILGLITLGAPVAWMLAPPGPLAAAYGTLPILSGLGAVYLAAVWISRRRGRGPDVPLLTVAFLLVLAHVGIAARKVTEAEFSCVEPIGRHLQEHLQADDQILSYRCNIRTLPFYVRRRVLLVDYEKDDDVFDQAAPEYRENVLFGQERLMERVRGPGRVWVVTKQKYHEGNPELAESTRVVDRNGSVVLLVNR